MSGPCQDQSGPAPPTRSWPEVYISHATPTFLELFHSISTPGEKMLFPLLVPSLSPTHFPLPRETILKPHLGFPWARRPCPSLLGAPNPFFFSWVWIPSCVHASVLLLPCLKVSLPSPSSPASSLSAASDGNQQEGWAHHLGPFLCAVPLTTLNSLFLAFLRSWGLLGPHRGGLFLWPPPFCSLPQCLLGCPRPGSASPISAAAPSPPTPGPEPA